MILDDLVAATEKRIAKQKEIISDNEMKKLALEMNEAQKKTGFQEFQFEEALKQKGISFICEIKKASPSKGVIAEDFPYLEIAKEYEKAGASAISVLTETDYFLGDIKYLKEIHDSGVKTPLLRKDFTIDEYMIYEAKVNGASCILLICAILDDEKLKKYLEVSRSLGLSAIVEAHDEEEVKRAVKAEAKIIGVNNRNLKDFTVDINNSKRLRRLVPDDILFIAESGIKTADDIKNLYDSGVDGVLIGETFMRSANKKEMLDELKRGVI
ncbi:MAG: indole-3-glycerol phosphate synthase TrpC [Butyrivibrio sp.]|nr:indole-3-glycerol phosphate synthase TrpC [Butyrivibrio sp.]